MKKNILKKLLPHFVAVLVFFAITIAYFNPLLQGKQIRMGDMLNYEGMAKEINDFREKTGEEALWTNSMFGGMPAYQISVKYYNNWVQRIGLFIRKIVPYPSTIIFTAMLCFYILLVMHRVHPVLAVAGAIAYAFSSYFFIIIEAGHITKAYAMAYLPLVVAGVLHTFKGNYLSGGALTALALSFQISANHLQITYYLLLILLIFGGIHFYFSWKEKKLVHFAKASGFLAIAALLAIGPNMGNILATYEYGKYTTRGPSELTFNKENKTTGLDKDYATSWSYGISETFSLIIPNVKGGGNGPIGKEHENVLEKIAPQQRQVIAQMDQYWGDQPFTSGPVYAGAFVMLLFFIGLFILEGPLKWWLIASTVLSLMLAWGKNFMPLTDFFLDYVPGYNKFRTVSMILIIAEFTIPFMAILTLQQLADKPTLFNTHKKKIYYGAGISLGICILYYLMPGLFTDFFGEGQTEQYSQMLKSAGFPENAIPEVFSELEKARRAILNADVLRSLFFIVAGIGLLFLIWKNKIKTTHAFYVVALLLLIDLWSVNTRYLNKENYVSKRELEKPYPLTSANLKILEDTDPNFRVYNVTRNAFTDASTSYFHKSIGGYHGAKLKRYQELIDFHIAKNNMQVLNMLNTKYFIVPDNNKQPVAQFNPEAFGNAWFIKGYKVAANADEEITGMEKFNLKDSAVIDKRFEGMLSEFSFKEDSMAKIVLTSYAPNKLIYQSSAANEQIAIFSEIHYDKGWNVFINDKPAEYFRANYVLRAMRIPAGNHKIEFRFEPKVYRTGENIGLASSILLFAFVGFALYKELKEK
ncbi:MAG: YfhO family protein [Flavobacteriales bacterium]|nr:YfhO family protein [Flavobacteriales bacterium]